MPALTSLTVADAPEGWAAAGFRIDHDAAGEAFTSIGAPGEAVIVRFASDRGQHSDRRGITSWAFDGLDSAVTSLDGIPLDGIPLDSTVLDVGRAVDGGEEGHLNGVSRLDHVVMMTPDSLRSQRALEAAGFECRRVRAVPGAEPAREQRFFWAGPTIIEMVGPAEPTGDGPASLWGLALTSDDLDAAATALGEALGTIKPAVQPGRRIATLRGRDLGVSVPIALMTPHGGTGESDGS